MEQYAKITLVDIRYLSSTTLGKYLTFTDQDVLFLYSVPVLNHSDTPEMTPSSLTWPQHSPVWQRYS